MARTGVESARRAAPVGPGTGDSPPAVVASAGRLSTLRSHICAAHNPITV
jgi:hypothetical protein